MPKPRRASATGAKRSPRVTAAKRDHRVLDRSWVSEQGLKTVLGDVIVQAVALERLVVRLQTELGLRRTELLVLLQLIAGGPSNMAAVSRVLSVSASVLTTAADGLEERGYAKRVRGVDDRRGICLYATRHAATTLQATIDSILDEVGVSRWKSGPRNVTLAALLGQTAAASKRGADREADATA